MKKLLLTIFVLFLGIGAYGQHFSNLPEKERNERLIKLARKELRTWNDGQYKDYVKYGIPEVNRYEGISDLLRGTNVGKVRYRVIFKFEKDDPREYDGLNKFIVNFSDKLGIPIHITASNYYGHWGKCLVK